jgi:carbonic anhydrase/acetyltransferase-like protein (isoleucine patch superfamily)
MPAERHLNTLSYLDEHPEVAGPPRHVGANSAVIGRVVLGADAWLGAASVIRADGHHVRAGRDLVLGHGATVHIAHDLYPTIIGDGVTVGSNAVIHACEVHDNCVVEDGAVVLDGCVVEAGSLIEAGTVVFPRSRLASGNVYTGRPAKLQRALDAGELGRRRRTLRERLAADAAERPAPSSESPHIDATAFIANTAILTGHVIAARGSSVWYGCELDAAGGTIAIGEMSNVQDNSILRCTPGTRLAIGRGSTIGHNVTMAECTIGDRSLIGIGSVLAAGTIVEDDVFLAAGATTLPGQLLTAGHLWGGQPARIIGTLDERKRALITTIILTYCGYASELARVQRAAMATQ